jgi:hypothetical protein
MRIEERTQELRELHGRIFRAKAADAPTNGTRPGAAPSLDDIAIRDKVCRDPKYAALWRGEWQGMGYPSQSEADLALVGRIAFFAGPDASRIDRLFRQSALLRDKWDDPGHGHAGSTYGADTITTALAGRTEFYDPSRPHVPARDRAEAAPPAPDQEPPLPVRGEQLDVLVRTAKETGDPAIAYDAAPMLAALSAVDLAKAKAALKAALGGNLNLNDLTRAVSEAKQDRRHAPPAISHGGGNVLPAIVASNRPLRDIADEALAVLNRANDPPELFVRTGAITRVRRDENARPIIEPVNESALRGRMTRTADFLFLTEQGERQISPPLDVVRDLLNLGAWPFPPLEAVVEAPVLRPDGTLLDAPGYDSATRLIFAQQPGLAWPKLKPKPSQEDAIAARRVLEEAFGEFPYADQASRANALGALITTVVRSAVTGTAPLALIDAPMPGTGKGFLTRTISEIATGRDAALMTAPRDEEEWRKRITSALIEGATMIVIDNIEHTLASDSLAAALTATIWKDRILGRTGTAEVPQRATWIATGNNVRLSGDMPRRCYWVRLDAKHSQPWRRTGFKHPDLLEWVREHRGELLGALLTMVRAWFVAGRPEAFSPVLGSFEEWSRIVGGVLRFAGVEGFLGNLDALYEQIDDGAPQWDAFLNAWFGAIGPQAVSVADLISILEDNAAIREALPDDLALARAKSEESFRSRLGKALAKKVEVRYRGLHLVREADDTHRGKARWSVRNASTEREQSAPLAPLCTPSPSQISCDYTHTLAEGVPGRERECVGPHEERPGEGVQRGARGAVSLPVKQSSRERGEV